MATRRPPCLGACVHSAPACSARGLWRTPWRPLSLHVVADYCLLLLGFCAPGIRHCCFACGRLCICCFLSSVRARQGSPSMFSTKSPEQRWVPSQALSAPNTHNPHPPALLPTVWLCHCCRCEYVPLRPGACGLLSWRWGGVVALERGAAVFFFFFFCSSS